MIKSLENRSQDSRKLSSKDYKPEGKSSLPMVSGRGRESVSIEQKINLYAAIDEEINSMMKVFEADQKRLKSIL